MKRWMPAALASLLLCIGFGLALTVYLQPMEEKVYDLSLFWEGEAMPENWVYDQKGWTVFNQQGEQVNELTPNGFGSFSGLSFPEQTFYFSRVMEEDLDRPTLSLRAAGSTIAVFLDGALIYSDCSELDNRIGYLQLPSLNYYREEPLLVTLPLNYAGKTLTIAQSADPETETDLTVTPCAVTVYCGYTYESALIAESFQTAIPTTLAFAVGVLLLGLFVWKAARKEPDPTLVCGALAAFLYLGSQMVSPSFFNAYFDTPPVDLGMLCRELALMNLLGLLLCKLSGWRRAPVWVALGGMGASLLAELVLALLGQAGVFARENGFALFGIAGLLAALVGGFWELRQGGWFFRVFCPVATAGIGLAGLAYGMGLLMSEARAGMLETQLAAWTFGYFLWRLMALCMVPAFLGAVVELIHEEIAARTEAHLLAQRTELALSSYQALLQHNEQVMMGSYDLGLPKARDSKGS